MYEMSKKCACLKVHTSRTCIHFIVIQFAAATTILVVLLFSCKQVCKTWTTNIVKWEFLFWLSKTCDVFFNVWGKWRLTEDFQILTLITTEKSFAHSLQERKALKDYNLWICNVRSIKVLVLFRFTLIIIFASTSFVHVIVILVLI